MTRRLIVIVVFVLILLATIVIVDQTACGPFEDCAYSEWRIRRSADELADLDSHLYSIWASEDGSHIVAGGSRLTLYESTDRGKTWATAPLRITSPEGDAPAKNDDVIGVAFTGKRGIALLRSGREVETDGTSWRENAERSKALAPLAPLKYAQLDNAGVRSVVDSDGRVFETLDDVRPLDVPRSTIAYGDWIQGAAHIRASVGEDIVHVEGEKPEPLRGARALAAAPPVIVVVGAAGNSAISENGGRSWSKRFLPSRENFNTVWVNSRGSLAFAAGDHGVILRSPDAGQTWFHVTYDRKPVEPFSGSSWPPLRAFVIVTFLIALSLVWKRPVSRLRQPIERLKERLRSDRPLENERGDLLGFAPVVEALANLVRSSDTSLPIVIAVNGAFGTGKSSIAKMVAERLRKHELKIVWFDAWHHQSESDLLASLFESVRQSIGLEELGFRLNLIRIRAGMNIVIALATSLVLVWCSRLFGVRETITRALAIAPVAYAAIQSSAVFGLLRPIAATFRLPILDAPLGLRQRFHKALGEVTKALGRRRLVIVIDDLDRADDDGRRTVLNAINFITAAADCAFILSMNRTEMKDYATLLEKIVDLNIGVPVMQADHMKHLLCDEAQPVFYWGAIRQHVRLDWGAIWRHDRHNWKAIWGHVRHDMRAIRRQLQQVLEAIRRDVQPIAEAMWRHIRHVVAPLAIVTIISVVVWAFTATLGGGGPETRWPSTARGETTATANPATTAPATTHEEAAAAPPTSPTRAAIHHIGQWPTAVFIVLGAAPVLLIILMLVRPGTPPVHDSPAFTAALEFWSDVIYAGHTTPRAVKRFANRARFYALYRAAERPTETTELSERTIVAAVANDEIDHRDDAVEKALVKHASLGSIDLRAEIAALQALRVYWRGDVEDDRDTN